MLTITMHQPTDALHLACLLIHLSQLDDPFAKPFVSTEKHRNWEWQQGITKLRGRNVRLSAADHQRCSTSASKSMGLHPHGKWESGIGTSYHQILQM